MLRKISDSMNHCVKCDDETKHLIWAFNHELILEPVCWRCFERADKRINARPGWTRMRRNRLNTAQPVHMDGKQNDRLGNLRLVQSGAIENQMLKQLVPTARPVAASRERAKAA